MISDINVRAALKKIQPDIDVDEVALDAPFSDYGFDSLDIFDMVLQMQELTGREVNDSEVEQLKAIQDVLNLFNRC